MEIKFVAAKKLFIWRCIGVLVVVAGWVITILLFVGLVNDEKIAEKIENSGKVYVSSFVVDGIDYGNGYFVNEGPIWNPKYQFYNNENKERVFFKIDSYVEDSNKVQSADFDCLMSSIAPMLSLIITLIGGFLVYVFLFLSYED